MHIGSFVLSNQHRILSEALLDFFDYSCVLSHSHASILMEVLDTSTAQSLLCSALIIKFHAAVTSISPQLLDFPPPLELRSCSFLFTQQGRGCALAQNMGRGRGFSHLPLVLSSSQLPPAPLRTEKLSILLVASGLVVCSRAHLM